MIGFKPFQGITPGRSYTPPSTVGFQTWDLESDTGFGGPLLSSEISKLSSFPSHGMTEDMAYNRLAKMYEMVKKMKPQQQGPAAAHTKPEAPGSFQLGGMQGSRVKAYERRIAERVDELKKKQLTRVGTGDKVQQEAKESSKPGRT